MKAKTDEVDVNKEDQNYINEFSRLYAKNKVIDADIKKLNELIESLADADTAINESFESKMKLSIGESFVETNENQAKDYVQRMRKKHNLEKTDLVAKYEVYKKRIDEIKIILYAKFGKRLRLEED